MLILSAPAARAAPRDELLRLVPADVGFCLVIDDLRGHGKALVESPFLKQFRDSPVASKLVDAQAAQKLGLVDQFLQQYLQVSAEQIRDEILGDTLVLAYRPGPPDRPGEEQGLFLIRARDARLLADLVGRLNALQKASGDLEELRESAYAGRKYFTRVESKGNTQYYYLRGPVLAFASTEATLKQLMDRDQNPAEDGEPPLAQHYRLLGVEKPLAALWINPRAFDTHLEKKVAAAPAAQARTLKTLLRYWHTLEGLAVTADLKEDFELKVAVRARSDALPASVKRYFATAAAPSELWGRFPENALFAVAGRTDALALVDILSEFLTEDARTAAGKAVAGSAGAIFGKDVVQEILPALGPDWGFCAVAPPAGEKNWFPQLTAAIRIQPGKSTRAADLTIIDGLNTLAAMAVFHHNGGKPGALSLKSELQDQLEVRYLSNEKEFPLGLQPAFALKGGYLVLAGSPEVIRRFPASSRPQTRAPATAEFPLLRLSFVEACRYLTERRGVFVALAAKQHHISEDEAGSRLDGLLAALQFLERMEVSQRPDPGRVILTLRVRMTKPLR